jgi:multidrug efflux system outer membrane protein
VKRLLTATLCLTLQACMVGPDYERPQVESSESWHVDLDHQSGDPASLADQAWIDIFRDEQLRAVVEKALAENKQMLIAIERIEEARALHRINRAALFPTIDLELNSEREEESDLTNTDAETADEFFFGPTISWELDLWGGNRRASRSAYARYLASEYGAQAVRLSLIAQVCQSYFELQGINARLDTNYDTLASRERSLVIADKRFKGGLTSKLEVKQAEVELATSRAFIPRTEQAQLAVENQLAVLVGQSPRHFTLATTLEEQHIPLKVTAGLPSSLLQRRPDIMQAEQELIAASEAVGVATARLFPNITLTGGLGYESDDFNDLLDDDGEFWIARLDIAMPLFNAGARRAQLSATESRFNQSRLAYELSVIEALREVSDSLNKFYKAGESLQAELALEEASRGYLELATKRHRNGVLAYLDVLDAQRQLFDAQIAESVAREGQLVAMVGLYKALGGGWDPASVITAQEDTE